MRAIWLFTTLILFGGSYVRAQEPVYYWNSPDTKKYFQPIMEGAAFTSVEDSLSADLIDWLTQREIIIEFVPAVPRFFAIMAHSSKIAEFMQKYQDDEEIAWADYVYKDGKYYGGARPEILIRPLENTTLSELEDILVDYGITNVIPSRIADTYKAYIPPKSNVWDIANAIHESGTVFYASPNLYGFVTHFPFEVFVKDRSIIPFSISVFPNPANPVATINYSIPHDSEVLIDVYSITGQRIATLVEDFNQAGSHSVVFDGSSLSSGVYFYRVSAGRLARTGKITLVK